MYICPNQNFRPFVSRIEICRRNMPLVQEYHDIAINFYSIYFYCWKTNVFDFKNNNENTSLKHLVAGWERYVL